MILKMKNKLNLMPVFYFLLFVVLILVGFSFYLFLFKPLRIEIFDVKFSVGDSLGISLNTSELDFGRIVPGNSVTRRVNIANNYDFPVELKIFVSKGVSEFIFSEEDIFVPPRESVSIPVILDVPDDMDFGNYSGKIEFYFYKD